MSDEKHWLKKELDSVDKAILRKVKNSRQPYHVGTLLQQFDEELQPNNRVRNLLWYGYLKYEYNSMVKVHTMDSEHAESPYECVLDIVEQADEPLLMQEIAYRAYSQCNMIDTPEIVYPILRDLKSQGFVITTVNQRIKFSHRDLSRSNLQSYPYNACEK